MNNGIKKMAVGMLLTFFYLAVFFTLAYFITLFLVWIADVVFKSASVEVLSIAIGTTVFLFIGVIEIIAAFKGIFWSPVTILVLIPFIIVGIIQAAIKKTTYSFDMKNPPEKIKNLKGGFITEAYMKKHM
jgi:uncharacterized membrane protein HdeD (DUF308 family)